MAAIEIFFSVPRRPFEGLIASTAAEVRRISLAEESARWILDENNLLSDNDEIITRLSNGCTYPRKIVRFVKLVYKERSTVTKRDTAGTLDTNVTRWITVYENCSYNVALIFITSAVTNFMNNSWRGHGNVQLERVF